MKGAAVNKPSVVRGGVGGGSAVLGAGPTLSGPGPGLWAFEWVLVFSSCLGGEDASVAGVASPSR